MKVHIKTQASFASVLLLAIVAALIAPTSTLAETALPSAAQLELEANLAFNRGDYKTALPILKKVADSYQDDSARQGSIKEKIKVCEVALASLKTNPPATQPANSTAMSARNRRQHPAPKPGEMLEMSIKELGNFEYDPENGLKVPADVARLNGSKIRLTGFMLPMDQAEAITQFALVPSLFDCCNGLPPQIQHIIVVNCPKGKAVGYCPDAIVIEGTLSVVEKKDGGYVESIFEVEVSSVKPAPK